MLGPRSQPVPNPRETPLTPPPPPQQIHACTSMCSFVLEIPVTRCRLVPIRPATATPVSPILIRPFLVFALIPRHIHSNRAFRTFDSAQLGMVRFNNVCTVVPHTNPAQAAPTPYPAPPRCVIPRFFPQTVCSPRFVRDLFPLPSLPARPARSNRLALLASLIPFASRIWSGRVLRPPHSLHFLQITFANFREVKLLH
jgi:hypothetical protein